MNTHTLTTVLHTQTDRHTDTLTDRQTDTTMTSAWTGIQGPPVSL